MLPMARTLSNRPVPLGRPPPGGAGRGRGTRAEDLGSDNARSVDTLRARPSALQWVRILAQGEFGGQGRSRRRAASPPRRRPGAKRAQNAAAMLSLAPASGTLRLQSRRGGRGTASARPGARALEPKERDDAVVAGLRGGQRVCPAPDAPFGRGGAPGRSATGNVVSGARRRAGRRTQPGRPGGPRTLTRRPATLEPSGRTLWVGAELDQPEHPPGVLRGAPPPRCLASTAARSRTQPSPLPRRAPRPGPSAGEHRDGARRRAPSARRRAATARPGADSRACPAGVSDDAAVVLERAVAREPDR